MRCDNELCLKAGRSDVAFTLSSFKIDRKLVYGDTNILDDVDVS